MLQRIFEANQSFNQSFKEFNAATVIRHIKNKLLQRISFVHFTWIKLNNERLKTSSSNSIIHGFV